MTTSPCKRCEKRGCGAHHDSCEKYKEYRDDCEKVRKGREKAYASWPLARRHWPTAETNSILKSRRK